jgi:hypothetical protein
VVVGASILLFPIAVSMNSKAIIVKHLLSSKMTNLQLSNKNILWYQRGVFAFVFWFVC